MKFAAAYLLACLGAEQAAAATEEGAAAVVAAPAPALPTKDDVRRILGSVGAEVEEDRLGLLFALMDGKDIAELIAAGGEQLAYAPSGVAAAAAVVAAPAAGAETKEEAKKEEEEEEDDGDALFNLFD